LKKPAIKYEAARKNRKKNPGSLIRDNSERSMKLQELIKAGKKLQE
jgi:hypothetical protein